MTELATRNGGTAVTTYQDIPQQHPAVASLVAWAESARAAHEVADVLVKTSFVPESFRNKAHEATAAILSGAEVGLSPMASLRSFDVIQGQAAPRALTLRAVVQSAGHEIWTKESTATRAIVCGRRRGSAQVETSTWHIDRAKQLKLTGKQNWQNQPTAMLLARATSECARLIAADAILGIPYSAEELEDGGGDVPAATMVVEQVAPAKRTMRRAAPAAVAPPEPEFDPPTEPDVTPPADPDPVPETGEAITKDQMRKLHASFGDLGIEDRDARLDYSSLVIGREISTSNDLTKREASAVIDALTTDINERNEQDAGGGS